uniref:Iron-binding zinc finger CDGSH type domain-containing protein n=1 Tax=Monopterus albus TaxID=43700 RepID=A0A3Q3Q9Y5_MONAL|nr:CDGSH iron-sulfur domain-containing protein 3, mitochondrial [Monopterus albus]
MNTTRFIVAVRSVRAQTFIRPQPGLFSKVQYCQQSTQPIPAARLPYKVKVLAGKPHAWCACGHSKKQPFCDGSHKTKAPGISPVIFTPDKDRKVLLCACKQTKNKPYCDGTHLRVIFQDLLKSVKGVFK